MSVDFIEAIRRESEAFARAADDGDLTVHVPACPDWMLGDLTYHLTGVQWFWTQIVAGRLLDREQVEGSSPDGPDEQLVERFRPVAAELIDALERTDPATRLYSWAGGEQDAMWVCRRQAHEVAVHRWDAESVSGTPQPIEATLAFDGVGEWLEWMADPEELAGAGPFVLRLVASDLGKDKVLAVGEDGQRAHLIATEPDATVEATSSDLDLLLWRRVSPDDVTIEGDREVVSRFLAAADLS
jgi:uncharacterized protein (TIGR03083 family)